MTPNASIPAPYVAGRITLTPNVVANVLDLIQAQLAYNCPGAASEFMIAADASNTGSVNVGAAGQLSGPLSVTNYAYRLTPTGTPRFYRASYPGNYTPLGELQVLATSPAILHVEVQA